MLFVVDKARLQRLIALARDDFSPDRQGKAGPYFRIEASADKLRLTGKKVEAEFPATIYEPGVLFLPITDFRRILSAIHDQPTITIQANAKGLFIDNVWFDLASNNILLYPDPARAPNRHPDESSEPVIPHQGADGPTSWGELFELSNLWPDPLKKIEDKK